MIDAVQQVAALRPGESYARSKFIQAHNVTPDRIRRTKRRLLSALTPVIARARAPGVNYHIHSFHSLTRDCDVVAVAVIVREPEL